MKFFSTKSVFYAEKVLEFSVLMFISCFAFGRSFKEVAMGLIVVCLFVLKLNKKRILPTHRLNLPLIIFGMTVLFSLFLSVDRDRSMDTLNDFVRASIILFGVAAYIKGEKEICRILLAFFFMVFLQGIDGVFQYIFGFDFIRGDKLAINMGMERVTGSFGYWSVGNVLALSLPMCFVLFEKVQKNWEKVFLFLGIVLVLITMILTKTRSSWISFTLAFIILFSLSKKKARYIPFFILPLFLLLFASPDLMDRFDSLKRMESSGRIGIWAVSFEMFKDSPVFGHGPGTFKEVYPQYKEEIAQYKSMHRTPHAHNIYIHALTDIGLIGLAGLAFLLYSIVRTIIVTIKKSRSDTLLYPFSVAVLASITVYIVEGFLTHGLFRMWLMQMFALIIGLAVSTNALAMNDNKIVSFDSEKG